MGNHAFIYAEDGYICIKCVCCRNVVPTIVFVLLIIFGSYLLIQTLTATIAITYEKVMQNFVRCFFSSL
jgi:hypothetical protein